MSDNLRGAAQAALETLEDVFGKDKIDVSAINNLRAALAEPVVKESLTTQPSETPLTDALDAKLTEREIDRALERELAAALEQRDKARNDALEEAAKICHTIAMRAFIEREAQRNGDFDHCSISEETGRYESAEECEREILALAQKGGGRAMKECGK